MTEPMESTPTEPAPPPSRPWSRPLELLAVVVAVAAAILLVAGILYGFASASATRGDTTERVRLLGQAANPFIAALAVAACVLVTRHRASQAFAGAAMGLGATVGFATVLLALNALIIDFTGAGSMMFKTSAAISRIATILLAGYAVWLAATSPPAADRP